MKGMSLSSNDKPTVPAPEIAFIEDQIKIAMSIIKYSNKIHKPILYNKITSNPIHERRWQKTIEEELQNLKNH